MTWISQSSFWFIFSVHLHNFCGILMMIWSFQTSLDSPERRWSDWNTGALVIKLFNFLLLLMDQVCHSSAPERNAHDSKIEKFCPLLQVSLRLVGAWHRTEKNNITFAAMYLQSVYSLMIELHPGVVAHGTDWPPGATPALAGHSVTAPALRPRHIVS